MWETIMSSVNITLIEPCFFEAIALVYVLDPFDRFTVRNVLFFLLKSIIVFAVYAVLLTASATLLSVYEINMGSFFVYACALVVYVLAAVVLLRARSVRTRPGLHGGERGEKGSGTCAGRWYVSFFILSAFAVANITVNVAFSMSGRLIQDAGMPGLGYLMSLLFKPAFYVLNAFLVGRFSLRRFDRLPSAAMAVFTVTDVLLIGCVMTFDARPAFMEETLLNLLVNILVYVLVAMLYASMYLSCTYYSGEMERTVEVGRISAQNEELRLRERSYDEMRRIRHDIKNQYAYMDMLIREGRYDDLGRYFEGMKGSFDEGNAYIDTGNTELNTMLNMEQEKAAEAGCRLETDVAVPPRLGISELDLSVILMNAIDNAIEANVRYGVTDPVRVAIKVSNDFLHIRVSNRLPEGVDEESVLSMETSKKDKADHGIGHRTIERVCESHDGACEFVVENGRFLTDAIVQLEEEGDEEVFDSDMR